MKLSEFPIWLLVVLMLASAALGAWGEYTWGLRQIVEKPGKPTIVETVVTQTDTKIEYVPGETVYVTVTGQPEPVAAKLDGKFTFEKPEFLYTVNGKVGKFSRADDERFIFDKNMMKLTQTSTIRIEAEIPTIDKTKRNSLGLWMTNQGAAISVGHAPNARLEFKGLVSVPDPKKLYGGGIELRF